MALSGSSAGDDNGGPSSLAHATLEPGSAVSMQLIRGDLEVAATCTVTYIDRKQLLACGHPVLGAGPVSLPMTTADVVTTLASPLDSFKIINTGANIGAFTQDRESAIRGVLGAKAHMIPMHVTVECSGRTAEGECRDSRPAVPDACGDAGGSAQFTFAEQRGQRIAELPRHRECRSGRVPSCSSGRVGFGRRNSAGIAAGCAAGG